MKRKFMRNKYAVALKIVCQEAKARRSLKPFKLLWKKSTYGRGVFRLHNTNLINYIQFCRVNRIPEIYLPEEELA